MARNKTDIRSEVQQGDCLEKMSHMKAGSVHLAFADPPFNIGYDYDVYDDRRSSGDYLDWSKKWMASVQRVLRDDGTFWLAIGDEYAAELKILATRELGFVCRSWVIWYYTFGVNCKHKFNRSHAHLFQFVKDPKKFTFNSEDPAVRVPSARQLVYGDKRANPRGRLPDDTWILRPQDLPGGFSPTEDTWYFARVAGTFKERAGFHGCQMPEQLLGRIVRFSSNQGDLILDPFAGSGTTLAVAKKLDRRYVGIELSSEYVSAIEERLKKIDVGDSLLGPADPVKSSPSTRQAPRYDASHDVSPPQPASSAEVKTPVSAKGSEKNGADTSGKKKKKKAPAKRMTPLEKTAKRVPGRTARIDVAEQVDSERAIVIEAYRVTHRNHSVDRVLADPELNKAFVSLCRESNEKADDTHWNRVLLSLRKTKQLPRSDQKRSRMFSQKELDSFLFGSEMAVSLLLSHLKASELSTGDSNVSIDNILCDPKLAANLVRLAKKYAPGYQPLEYRWGALALRKRASAARKSATLLNGDYPIDDLPIAKPLSHTAGISFVGQPGVYLLRNHRSQVVYVGESLDVGDRVDMIGRMRQSAAWLEWNLRFVQIVPIQKNRQGLQSKLIGHFHPPLNYAKLAASEAK